VLDAVALLVTAYLDSLKFSRDERWEHDGSPYDAFLETNQFPRRVDAGATERYYNRHLADLFLSARDIIFVSGTNGVAPPAPGRFKTLQQDFRFGPIELAGARIFFTTPDGGRTRGVGNCVACHPAPNFTDFRFHNTGVAQEEYDALHGAGAFAKLKVPGLARRNAGFDAWLPPTARHPRARGPFLDIPAADQPGRTDLGLWNVFANPGQPRSQDALRALLNGAGGRASDADLLPRTVALFKTPGLRGLAFSDPYLHNGRLDTLEDVIRFYIRTSALARAGRLRNAAPELSGMHLRDEDVAPLAAFLNSLNEDYE
jgi:cytochrome c peroxidase